VARLLPLTLGFGVGGFQPLVRGMGYGVRSKPWASARRLMF